MLEAEAGLDLARDAKFVAYVGHDTNIANLAGIMDVTWTQAGYQRNQTPPAGALVFEVRLGPDKKQRVYTSYLAQSPEQMRKAVPLTLELPPAESCGTALNALAHCAEALYAQIARGNVITPAMGAGLRYADGTPSLGPI